MQVEKGMTETHQPTVTTHTIGEGEDTINYDVYGDLSAATPDRPALLAFANPMEAAAFAALAAEIQDRPVVTIDPRGAGRNPTGTSPLTPGQHADDLHRVIEALGVGPVDAFGSSGGAICLLALLEAHPDDVRCAVVHEPPFVDALVDGDVVLAACTDIRNTYDRAGTGPAMAKFIALVMRPEPLPADYLDHPAPDPAAFGMSAEDDGDRTNPLMRNMPGLQRLRAGLHRAHRPRDASACGGRRRLRPGDRRARRTRPGPTSGPRRGPLPQPPRRLHQRRG